MAVRQCRSSDVSSGEILGNDFPVGWYCTLPGIAPLLCCVCNRAAMCTSWMTVPYLSTKALRYLQARIAARLVPGPFSAWFLYADARISLASSSGGRGGSCLVPDMARGVPLSAKRRPTPECNPGAESYGRIKVSQIRQCSGHLTYSALVRSVRESLMRNSKPTTTTTQGGRGGRQHRREGESADPTGRKTGEALTASTGVSGFRKRIPMSRKP